MKLALLGYGKMGRMIEQLAIDQGHQVVGIFSRTSSSLSPDASGFQQADVCLDFSHPACLRYHVQLCSQFNKPLVIGTTGWEEHKEWVIHHVKQSKMGCFYAPNFSIGMQLFIRLVTYAAQLVDLVPDYDISGIEYHHRQKVDAPSGTAKALTQQLLSNIKRLKQLDFASVRCGSIPGIHTICFDSPVDTITLTHQARSREGLASGALTAAEWLIGKQGFFTLEDLLNAQVD